MYRGKVTAVDAGGVYVQTAEFGVIGPCQAVVANYAFGDMVLLSDVGSDAMPDLVVVGRLTGKGSAVPTSSTDNTVPRFDGTGGALQTSGVTVDDSNNVTGVGALTTTGNIQANKTTGAAQIQVASKSAETYLTMDGNSGGAYFDMKKAGVIRWSFFTLNGDTYVIRRYDDAGASLGDAMNIARSTGKVTVSAAGSTAGLEFGASGPTITTGTGAPSHSAPNGSTYHRTDGTASTTLYVRAAGAWSALS